MKTFGISRCPGRSKYVWRKGSSEDCIINKEISDKPSDLNRLYEVSVAPIAFGAQRLQSDV